MAPCVLSPLQDEQAGLFKRTRRVMRIGGGAGNGQKSCKESGGEVQD